MAPSPSKEPNSVYDIRRLVYTTWQRNRIESSKLNEIDGISSPKRAFHRLCSSNRESHPIPVVILLQNLHLVVHLARQSIVHLCSIEIKQHLSLTRHTALATRAYTIIVKSVPIRPFLLKSGTIRLQWSLIIKACLNEQAGVSFDPHFLENGV